MSTLEEMDRAVYDEVPEGLVDLPTAAARHGVTRNALHKRLASGTLQSYGRLKGRSLGGGSPLLAERELLQIIDSMVLNKNRLGRPRDVPSDVDTGCEYSPSCLDCPLPKCKEDMTLGEQMKLRRDLLPMKHLRRQEQGRRVWDQQEALK